MTRRYLAFDIETAADIPGDGGDWRHHRPLGITCAAALGSDDREPITWHAQQPDGTFAPRMSAEQVGAMVEYLGGRAAEGDTVLTWNGLGFDFDILAEESGAVAECRALAIDHVDMMFHVLCDRGFPVALAKAAHALGIPGKPDGMSGALAPTLWAQGKQREVLDYVAQDVRIALGIARVCEERGTFLWTTRKGTRSSMPLASGWLTVRDAMHLPEPDTSWMTNPLSRREVSAWLEPR